MKVVSTFIKQIRDFFHEIKTKGRDREKVYTKFLLPYKVQIEDLIKIVKEELSNIKLYIKIQVVAYHNNYCRVDYLTISRGITQFYIIIFITK